MLFLNSAKGTLPNKRLALEFLHQSNYIKLFSVCVSQKFLWHWEANTEVPWERSLWWLLGGRERGMPKGWGARGGVGGWGRLSVRPCNSWDVLRVGRRAWFGG